MFRRRRPRPPADWFTCPVCGSEVRVGALACRECGSDDTTGWSEATAYDDLDLPEPEGPGGGPAVPDTFEEFEELVDPPRAWPRWVVLGFVALALVLVLANAVGAA